LRNGDVTQFTPLHHGFASAARAHRQGIELRLKAVVSQAKRQELRWIVH
jgi:hypothetical protein